MEDIERVRYYEKKLRRIRELNQQMMEMIEEFTDGFDDAMELSAYYESDQWLRDTIAAADGVLPADLKTTVLNEDDIYNTLETYSNLLELVAEEADE